MSTESEKAREALIAALEKEPDILPREAERIVDRVLARLWIEGLVLTCHKGPSTNPKETRMTRVRITGGFLNIGRRNRPGIDNELPGAEGPTDPDYGIDEGSGGAGIDNELPNPPPGVWPPLTPEQPWRPVDPGFGQGRPPHIGGGPARPGVGGGRPDNTLPGEGGEHPELPPGTIWPPLPPGVHGKYWALVLVKGASGAVQYRYVVIDADARPGHELPDEEPPPVPQPKKA